MTLEERTTWAGLVSLVAVPAAYAVWLATRGGVAPVDWQRPLVVAFVSLVVVGLIASIAVSVAAAARAQADGELDDFDRVDERDVRVRGRGARVSGWVLGAWVVVTFVLAVSEVPPVWIAHALFAAVVTGGASDAAARIAAYRRG